MEVQLVADQEQIRELVQFQLTSQLTLDVKDCDSKSCAELLKKSEKFCDLLIMPYEGPESALWKALVERKSDLPFLLYFDPSVIKLDTSQTAGLPCLGFVELSNLAEGIISLTKELLKKRGESLKPAAYCPIKTNLLARFTPLNTDIYIRLSEKKYLRLFKSGDTFGKEDLEKYCEKKGIEFMYLKGSGTKDFARKFSQELDALVSKSNIKPEEAQKTVEEVQEAIQELVNSVGFTPEVQQLAKKNVQLAMKQIGSNPKLSTLLSRMQGDANYVSRHSNILAEISCCLAKEMEWGSESTFSKLVLASLMHDVALKDQKLAQIGTLKELEDRKGEFSAEEVTVYQLHSVKAAEVVRAFQEIPPDVDIIVLQHHERPNGSGFPRGLAHNHIAPLAALFIVAHDLVQEMLKKRENFSVPAFIEEKKPFYNAGNFRKLMVALAKLNV
jgi:HD-GYP domain-containing protein (c-di-GMP phosphodiesterase class II)